MMKSFPLVFALFCALVFQAAAQPATDKVAGLKVKFTRGKELAEQGQFTAALQIFKSILAEDPEARGSLFMAGVTSNLLYDYAAAASYLEKFLKLEPQHTAGLINAVKANQALNNEAKVEEYRTRLFEKRRLRTDPVLNMMETYERQRIGLKDGGYLSVLEAFSPSGKEAVFSVIRLSEAQRIVSKEEVVKAPADAGAEMKGSYLWAEPHYKGDVMERYEIKKVFPAKPTYKEVQDLVMEEYGASLQK